MTTLGPPSPYRNDEEARDLLVEKLQFENDELETENEALCKENERLRIISGELMREPQSARDIDLRRRVTNANLEIARLNRMLIDSRRAFRLGLIIFVLLAAWPQISQLLAITLYR